MNLAARKILFVTATRLGDAVLSTGLLAYLAAANPDAEFTIACGPAAAPVFRAAPRLKKLIIMTKQPMDGHWVAFWRQCITARWDMIIDLRNSLAARLLCGRYYHLSKRDPDLHKVEENALILKLSPPSAPKIWLDKAAEDSATRLLPPDIPLLAIGATANWPGKVWPSTRFVDLIQRLTKNGGLLAGYHVVLFGAPGEEKQLAGMVAQLPANNTTNLAGKIDVLTAAAILQKCKLFIGNDSGLMHLAAAVGIPTLGLFGPSHPVQYRPWGRHTAFVKTALSYDNLVNVEGYNHLTTGSLMESLTVEKVLLATHDLWQKAQADG